MQKVYKYTLCETAYIVMLTCLNHIHVIPNLVSLIKESVTTFRILKSSNTESIRFVETRLSFFFKLDLKPLKCRYVVEPSE